MVLQPSTLLLASVLAIILLFAPLGLPEWVRFALLITMPGWLGPIVVHWRQTQPRAARFMTLPSDDPSVPGAIRAAFEATRAELTGHG